MPFLACGGCIKDIFVTEEELIDRFTEQQLMLWGTGIAGVLGNNATTNRSSPVQTISGGTNWRSASLGVGFLGLSASAIKTDGTLWTWGSASTGQLGNNSTISRSSPVQTISGGTNWRSVSLGFAHSAAIKTDAPLECTLWTWGDGAYGVLGTNSTISRSSPVQTISGGTNWKSVSSGSSHTAAIKTDGTLWLWGSGDRGRLGNNSTITRSSPVQTITGGTNWKSVSAGGLHSAAIKTDGSLWLWGGGTSIGNIGGQLGDNSIISRSSPVQTISGGTNWRSVSLGTAHSAAIKTDGSLWLWGVSQRTFYSTIVDGRLGNNSTISRSSPVQTISGGTNWRSVSLGDSHSAAIKTDGSLWLWGIALLGNNSNISRSSPVQTISGGTNWRSVSLGSGTSAATCVIEF